MHSSVECRQPKREHVYVREGTRACARTALLTMQVEGLVVVRGEDGVPLPAAQVGPIGREAVCSAGEQQGRAGMRGGDV